MDEADKDFTSVNIRVRLLRLTQGKFILPLHFNSSRK